MMLEVNVLTVGNGWVSLIVSTRSFSAWNPLHIYAYGTEFAWFWNHLNSSLRSSIPKSLLTLPWLDSWLRLTSSKKRSKVSQSPSHFPITLDLKSIIQAFNTFPKSSKRPKNPDPRLIATWLASLTPVTLGLSSTLSPICWSRTFWRIVAFTEFLYLLFL